MSNGHSTALARAKKQTEAGGKGPLWSLLFESLVRGITGAVLLFLVFILGTILIEGGPRVIGIQTNTAMLIQAPENENATPVLENRLLALEDAKRDPSGVVQTTLSKETRARLAGRKALVFHKKDAAVSISDWKTADVDGQELVNVGDNVAISDFRNATIDDGLRVFEYVAKPNLDFLTKAPRDGMKAGGIFPALFGTVFVVLFMISLALPIGVFGAVFMVEYTRGGIVARIIRAAVNNLAGVPSIVFGLFGLGFFVLFVGRHLDHYAFDIPRTMEERTVFEAEVEAAREKVTAAVNADAEARNLSDDERAAALEAAIDKSVPKLHAKVFGQGAMFWAAATLAILVLPVIIVSTEEALRAVPGSLREAAYGLGATKWQVVSTVVIPQARSGILTGAILALGRGAGELAPILFVGVTFFAPTLPLTEPINFFGLHIPVVNPFQPFMHLNYHIYTMATQHPDAEGTRAIQFGTTLVLVGMTFLMSLVAIVLRRKYSR